MTLDEDATTLPGTHELARRDTTAPSHLLDQENQQLADLEEDLQVRLEECWSLLGHGRSLRSFP